MENSFMNMTIFFIQINSRETPAEIKDRSKHYSVQNAKQVADIESLRNIVHEFYLFRGFAK